MSKVMRAIDAKSFIIGALSAVIVCMAMGAKMNAGYTYVLEYDVHGDITDFPKEKTGIRKGIPFAVDNGTIYCLSEGY